MNAALESARAAAAAFLEMSARAGARLQDTALEIIAGPGGPLVLVLGVLGVAVLAYDGLWLSWRLARGWFVRRAPAANREARVRDLADLGAAPAEIARAVGLSRDALKLVIPAELHRPKVPAAAQSAASPPVPAPAQVARARSQVVVDAQIARSDPPAPSRARPLPLPTARNANVPDFGGAA